MWLLRNKCIWFSPSVLVWSEHIGCMPIGEDLICTQAIPVRLEHKDHLETVGVRRWAWSGVSVFSKGLCVRRWVWSVMTGNTQTVFVFLGFCFVGSQHSAAFWSAWAREGVGFHRDGDPVCTEVQ